METIFTVKQLKQYSISRGMHFFSRESMRAFRSKIHPLVKNGENVVYFVTGEMMFDDRRRLYTARVMFDNGDVLNAFESEFQQFKSAKSAWNFIRAKMAENKGD